MPTVQRLVAYLADAPEPDPVIADMAAWLAASPRFRAFVEANRDKIRKKLRGATSADARLDVGAELRVAALLLADRRLELAFEAYGAGRRGPDFTVTFRAGRAFNVEVTRRRRPGSAALEPAILAKLRQLPPSASNVLVVATGGDDPPPDPGAVLRDLRARADGRDDAFFEAFGLDGSAAFHAGLLRLAAVVAVSSAPEGSARVASLEERGGPDPAPGVRSPGAAGGAGRRSRRPPEALSPPVSPRQPRISPRLPPRSRRDCSCRSWRCRRACRMR